MSKYRTPETVDDEQPPIETFHEDNPAGRGEPAPDADVCGALGCRTTEDLHHYRDSEGRKRVLCSGCGERFLTL